MACEDVCECEGKEGTPTALSVSGRHWDAEHCCVRSLCASGSRCPVQCCIEQWKSRAEDSQSQGMLLLSGRAPVPPCSSMDNLPGWNLYFSRRLRWLRLNYSVISSQKQSNRRTACSLAGPSVLWINTLTSSFPCEREVITSLFSCPLQLKDAPP